MARSRPSSTAVANDQIELKRMPPASSIPDAIILVGGRGTRLQDVVPDRPKALAPVAGRLFIDWIISDLIAQGIRRVVLATGYQAEMLEEHVRNRKVTAEGIEIVCSRESVPLGTGGALRHAVEKIATEQVLVMNGDSHCPFRFQQLLAVHTSTRAVGTLWVIPHDDPSQYGLVETTADGRIVGFHEKPGRSTSGAVNAGIYIFDRKVLHRIPTQRPVSLEREILPQLVRQKLYAVAGTGPFVDIGTPAGYRAANRLFAQRAQPRMSSSFV